MFFDCYKMGEAFVLLNVNYKNQNDIVEKVKQIKTVKSVRTVYGIYDILVVFESNDLQQVKNDIETNLHNIEGIDNLTTLISVS